MKTSGDSAHPCRSPTATVNGRGLTLLTRTQTSDKEYSDLTANNRRPPTPYSRNTPQEIFSRGNQSYAFSGRQNMCRRLWRTPKISEKFAGEWNLVCSATAGTKTALDIIQPWFHYFICFQDTWQCKCYLFENSQKASLAAQKALVGHICGSRAVCLRSLVNI